MENQEKEILEEIEATDTIENDEKKEDIETSFEEQQKIIERMEFDQEEGIEFQETITKEDALNFNYYLQNNSSNFTRRLFSSLLGVFLIGYVLNIKQYYWLIIVGLAMIVYSLYLYKPIQRRLTKRMFDKKEFKDLVVNVKLASKIKYELDTETISPLVPYDVIRQAVKTEKYIYLHISAYSVVIIKLEDLNELKEDVINFIKNKFEPINRYKEK
ncbi:MAG: hypothetical protein IKC22_02090 [Bacilli bacterium]|nr:hypothetical protein [Bacilli bacterium]